MSSPPVKVKLRCGLSESDPEQQPVLIVGQARHIAALAWNDVRCKLQPRVTEEAWRRGVNVVTESPGEWTEVWPRGASVATLPARRSRHAPPARPHALAKIVRSCPTNNHFIVLVCRKRDVLASCVAIARSYPLYSARSALGLLPTTPAASNTPANTPAAASRPTTVTVEILLVEDDGGHGDEGSDGEEAPAAGMSGAPLSLSAGELSTLQAVCERTRQAAAIADQPANIYNIDQFIEDAIKIANELNIEPPTIIRGEELLSHGMGGLYGVGRAAASPPALVALTYRPPHTATTPAPADSVAWVGKGIVYDTGGLSIKSRTSMVGMKGDCAGAAAVLCAFACFAATKPDVTVHAVLCLAENAVGPNATRPDDIHQLYSGRSVEINNTDAEGRLVLADGAVYAARHLRAATIVDIATLTGAQGIATGKYHAAVVSNRASIERRAVRAGLAAGEPAHPLPFAPELHATELASTVADMKNSVADRNNAQPSCAGLFILAHLGFDFPGAWLHIDMAAPAHSGERATGYGVALLCVLFGQRSSCPLLRAIAPS